MPRLANGMELQGSVLGVLGRFREFWGVLGSFAGWQTAGSKLHKKTMSRLANGMELQGSVLGVLGSFG